MYTIIKRTRLHAFLYIIRCCWKKIKKRGLSNVRILEFDDVIADIESNKKLSPIVTELFLRGRKLNIFLDFISQSYFKVPEIIRLMQHII